MWKFRKMTREAIKATNYDFVVVILVKVKLKKATVLDSISCPAQKSDCNQCKVLLFTAWQISLCHFWGFMNFPVQSDHVLAILESLILPWSKE